MARKVEFEDVVLARSTGLRRAPGKRVVAASALMVMALGGFRLVQTTDPRPESAQPARLADNGVLLSTTAAGKLVQVVGKRLSLPPHLSVGGAFRFTPDGRRIVYSSADDVLSSANLTTGHTRVVARCPVPAGLTGDACGAGALSPDGNHLVSVQYGTDLNLKNLRTGKVRNVFRHWFGDVTALTWAPEGPRVAYITTPAPFSPPTLEWTNGLHVVDTVTGRATHIARTGDFQVQPAWSPDGRRLAYIRHTRTGNGVTSFDLMTVPTAGGRPHKVRHLESCLCPHAYNAYGGAVAWAPDGTQIAVARPSSSDRVANGGPIFIVRPDGTGWHKVADGHVVGLAWQPLNR